VANRSKAVDAIVSGTELAKAAAAAGENRKTVCEWAARDPEFIASMNQAKQERLDQLRAEVSVLASEALGVVREMIRSDAVPPSVRLKACCVILAAADTLKPGPIGPTSVGGVQAQLAHRDLMESLGG
jgi:hypothetical protein